MRLAPPGNCNAGRSRRLYPVMEQEPPRPVPVGRPAGYAGSIRARFGRSRGCLCTHLPPGGAASGSARNRAGDGAAGQPNRETRGRSSGDGCLTPISTWRGHPPGDPLPRSGRTGSRGCGWRREHDIPRRGPRGQTPAAPRRYRAISGRAGAWTEEAACLEGPLAMIARRVPGVLHGRGMLAAGAVRVEPPGAGDPSGATGAAAGGPGPAVRPASGAPVACGATRALRPARGRSLAV